MNNQQQFKEQDFWCKRATVYFVYTFSLGEEKSYLVDPTLLEDMITSGPRFKKGIPEFRRGIMPHIEFAPCYGYVDYPSVTAQMRKNVDVEVGKLIRLFRTAGTCTIRITMEPPLGDYLITKDILRVLGLVGRLKRNSDSTQHRMLTMEDASLRSVYDIFINTVEDLCERSNDHLIWLEKELPFIEPNKEVQSPFVVTVAEVDNEVSDTFCEVGETGDDDPTRSKMLRIRQYERHLAPILFRTLGSEELDNWLRLDPSYLDPPTPLGIPGLYNQNIDSRLYTHFSRRSILCICRDKEKDPASFLLPDILSVCELVRSRWHMLIMMNKELDNKLQGMRNQLNAYIAQPETPIDREGQVETLMRLRSWLYTSYEDPGMYLIAGDAMSKLYEHMQKSFRINELRENVQGKLTLLDRLWNDFEEYEWLRSSPNRRYGRRPTTDSGTESG